MSRVSLVVTVLLGLGVSTGAQAQFTTGSIPLFKKGSTPTAAASATERSSLFCLARSGSEMKQSLDRIRNIPQVEVIIIGGS